MWFDADADLLGVSTQKGCSGDSGAILQIWGDRTNLDWGLQKLRSDTPQHLGGSVDMTAITRALAMSK